MFGKVEIQAQIIKALIRDNAQEDPHVVDQNSRIGSANHLARTVAYELDRHFNSPGEEECIDVFDSDGNIRSYSPHLIYTRWLGIVSYILIGQDEDNTRIHLVFRGSKDLPAWFRNVESGAPGTVSFLEDKDTILTELCAAIMQIKSDKKLQLIISGHSLGGADAQNSAAAIIVAMAHVYEKNISYKNYEALTRIDRITVNAINSAGITNVHAIECKLHAEYLTKKHGVTFNLVYMLNAGDVVPQSGQSHLFSDCDKSVATVELVKVKSKYEGWISKPYLAAGVASLPATYAGAVLLGFTAAYASFRAHKLKFVEKTLFKKDEYEAYDNTTQEGSEIIKSKLNKHALNTYSIDKVKYFVSTVQLYLFARKLQRTFTKEQEETLILISKDEEGNVTEQELQPISQFKQRKKVL